MKIKIDEEGYKVAFCQSGPQVVEFDGQWSNLQGLGAPEEKVISKGIALLQKRRQNFVSLVLSDSLGWGW